MAKNSELTATEKFILDNSKHADGVRTMTPTNYLNYMETVQQITPETVKAVAVGDQTLASGLITVGTSDLAEAIKAAKKSGEDPSELVAVVKVGRPGGQMKVSVAAEATVPNPKTGERHTKYGVVTVRLRTSTMIDEDAVKRTQEGITALMGG